MGNEDNTEEFDPITFEKKLSQLNGTQDCIQSMSAWCLKRRSHHKKIVASWLSVLKRVKIEQRLVLFYLANDVIQYSKRKNFEFVESWGLNLQKATPLVRDDKVRQKILRIFKIWEERRVYDEEFLADLTGLLSVGAVNKTDDDAIDFQPQQLVKKIKQCSALEEDTDNRLKDIHECKLEMSDADALCANLKEKRNIDEVEKELGEGIGCIEKYTKALQREIVAREALLALLTTAHQYYATQRGEVKVVANAYKNFGARVRLLKRKLDELIEKLPQKEDPSPPRPETVPSPQPDDDLPLPGDDDEAYNPDRTFTNTLNLDTSYNASFLNSDINPLNFFKEVANDNENGAGSKIEVISARGTISGSDKQDFSISEFLKSLSNDSSSGTHNNRNDLDGSLPGLDLLSSDVRPPTSFYGSAQTSVHDESDAYQSDDGGWSNPVTWSTIAPTGVPPPTISLSNQPILSTPVTPVSTAPVTDMTRPPPAVQAPYNPYTPYTQPDTTQDASYSRVLYTEAPASPPMAVPPPILFNQDTKADGDQLVLPPPPPPPLIPPNITLDLEDVDHRVLPNINQTSPTLPVANSQRGSQDVDHRNLISLTTQNMATVKTDMGLDQDYRLPPPVLPPPTLIPPPSPMALLPPSMPPSMPPPSLLPPNDIVEAVDMDLSEEDDAVIDPYNPSQSKIPRMDQQQGYNNYFNTPNNNKVLTGNGKPNMPDSDFRTMDPNYRTHRPPSDNDFRPLDQNHRNNDDIEPLSNPFDNMPYFEDLQDEKYGSYNDVEGNRPQQEWNRPEFRPRFPPRQQLRPFSPRQQQFRPRFMPRQNWQPRPRYYF